MDERAVIEAIRKRAYELADTARYPGWPEIAGSLNRDENFPAILVRRAGNDALFVSTLNTRCRLARERNA